MAIHTIPLSGFAEQFTVALNGTSYLLRTTFCEGGDGAWILDIADANGTPMLCGMPLLPGRDLLEQFDYLAIGGQGSQLILKSDGSSEPPGRDNLAACTLVFVDGAN